MDVREKLVELIVNASHECDDFYDLWDMRQAVDCIADLLIAHGVTVQEWISVKDRLPKLDEAVLVHPKYLHIKTSYYAVWSLFKCHSGETIWVDKSGDGHNLTEVTHWVPLPQPPKGD